MTDRIAALILGAAFVLAQRGGGVQQPINVMPACDPTYGACPRADYFCRDADSAIRVCTMPNIWTRLGGNPTTTVAGEVDGTLASTTVDRAIAPTWTGEHQFSAAQKWDTADGMYTPPATTFPGGQSGGSCAVGPNIRFFTDEPPASGGDASGSCSGADSEFRTCLGYNVATTNCNSRQSTSDYQLAHKFVWGWTNLSNARASEWHYQHTTAGGTQWFPWQLDISGVATESPSAIWELKLSPSTTAIACNANRCAVQGASTGNGDFEIVGGAGGGDLYLTDDIKFDGTTVGDGFLTTLSAKDPATGTAASNSIILPDATGRVVLTAESALAGIVRWGDGSEDAFDTGTELCSASDTTCVDAHAFSGGVWVDSACGTDQTGNMFMAFCRRNTGS